MLQIMKGGKKLHITPAEIKAAATLPKVARCRTRNRHIDANAEMKLYARLDREQAKNKQTKVKH